MRSTWVVAQVVQPRGDHLGEFGVEAGVARSLLVVLTGEGVSVIGMDLRGVDEVLFDGDLA
jgi:hypothetical protein